jgi:hypothetical protein
MKRTATLMTGVLLLGVALNTLASLTITLDENGNSTQNGSLAITHSQTLDPGTGLTTLTYAGFSGLAAGWLRIHDPSSGVLSDYIHFRSNGTVVFYSADSGTDLADVWPTPVQVGTAGPFVDLTEDASGNATYTPVSGALGYLAGGVTWQFISSPVPEPTTMIAGGLLLLPFGASTLRILRKNRIA